MRSPLHPPEVTRRLRGWVLQFLAQTHVRGDGVKRELPLDTIRKLVTETALDLSAITEVEVAEAVYYLRDKGYVTVMRFAPEQQALLPGRPASGARLTAAGTDVVDGTVQDPGVDLGVFG